MSSKTRLIVVLSVLLVGGLALSTVAAWRSWDWWGFALNLGTELVGAVAIYPLFELFVERREEQEKERETERRRLKAEKAELIREMGSSVKDVAVAAVEKLGQNGVEELVIVPVSFVSDHIETLHEIDIELKELALASGIKKFIRTRSFNDDPQFIELLAGLVREKIESAGKAAS